MQHCVISLERSTYPSSRDAECSLYIVPVELETNDQYDITAHPQWDQFIEHPRLPDGWSLYSVIEVPPGDEDLRDDLYRDINDDFGRTIANWQFDPMEDRYEVQVDLSSIEPDDLLTKLQSSIAKHDRDRWTKIEGLKSAVSGVFKERGLTSVESFEEFAVVYAQWLVQLRQEGEWELFYEDGTRSGPMYPSALVAKFFGEGDHAARLFNYHPIRPRLESELYRHFLKNFKGMYERADSLWQVLQLGRLSTTARDYLAKVAECYLLNLRTQGAVMCRATLESAYKARTEDSVLLSDKRYHRKSSSRGVDIFIGHRQRYLENEKIIRGRRLRFAEDIREAGNDAVHADAVEEPDLLPIIAKLSEVLEALFPQSLEELEAERGVMPRAVKPGLAWVRPVKRND